MEKSVMRPSDATGSRDSLHCCFLCELFVIPKVGMHLEVILAAACNWSAATIHGLVIRQSVLRVSLCCCQQ
eukprot:2843440-Amphidinium_carterae.3